MQVHPESSSGTLASASPSPGGSGWRPEQDAPPVRVPKEPVPIELPCSKCRRWLVRREEPDLTFPHPVPSDVPLLTVLGLRQARICILTSKNMRVTRLYAQWP